MIILYDSSNKSLLKYKKKCELELAHELNIQVTHGYITINVLYNTDYVPSSLESKLTFNWEKPIDNDIFLSLYPQKTWRMINRWKKLIPLIQELQQPPTQQKPYSIITMFNGHEWFHIQTEPDINRSSKGALIIEVNSYISKHDSQEKYCASTRG